MKTYSKLQILEVFARQRQVMAQDECTDDCFDMFDAFVDDFVGVLEGSIRPTIAKETLLIPGFGFVPVIGTVDDHGIVHFYDDNDNGHGGEA